MDISKLRIIVFDYFYTITFLYLFANGTLYKLCCDAIIKQKVQCLSAVVVVAITCSLLPTFRPTPNCTSSDPSQKVLFIRPLENFKLMQRPQQKIFSTKVLGAILCMVNNQCSPKEVSVSTGLRDRNLVRGRI